MAVTSTFRTPLSGTILVRASTGQFLQFTLTCVGPQPIFTFTSADQGTLFKNTDFGGPRTSYQWRHYDRAADPKGLDVLGLTLSFLINASYDYKVELCDATGVISTVLDATFAGAPTDIQEQDITAVAQ